MNVSLDWLRDYVSISATADEVAERLTMTLTEVEEVHTFQHLENIVVGEILTITKHPDADSLWLTTVYTGKLTSSIVCGAQNLSVGAKVPVALPGSTLPDGLEIGRRKIRGVESAGMLCSAKELGAGDDHSGVWILPADAGVGKSLPEALAGAHDTFLLDVLANRPDTMGHIGVAREVAAALEIDFSEPPLRTSVSEVPGNWQAVIDTPGCSRFSIAIVEGLSNGPSPEWLQQRLKTVGVRPISAIVDITNYVMLEYGQPLHAFDHAKLTGEKLTARPAKSTEKLVTLDGVTRALTTADMVVADAAGPQALAGIMGGKATEVGAGTTAVVLECAHWDGAMVRRTARRTGVRTEASARFERGISEELTMTALLRAIDLLKDHCGGTLQHLSDERVTVPKPTVITLPVEGLNDFLGTSLDASQVSAILKRLGFAVTEHKNGLQVTVPVHRTDVHGTADLYEEVVRIYGYDKVAATTPTGAVTPGMLPEEYQLRHDLTQLLVGLGWSEVFTHSMVGEALMQRSGLPADQAIRMANPLSTDHALLRPSLVPRHLESIRENLRWKPSVRLLEAGRVFYHESGAVTEAESLLLSFGTATKEDQFALMRGTLEAIWRHLHGSSEALIFTPLEHAPWLGGRSFAIKEAQDTLGSLTEYAAPQTWKARQIVMLELRLDALLRQSQASWQIEPPPAFPAISRDISVLVPEGKTYAQMRQVILESKNPSLYAVGDPQEYVSKEGRSLTVRLQFRSPVSTLTDDAVGKQMQPIIKRLEKTGFRLRG